jgi:hypothetical protein
VPKLGNLRLARAPVSLRFDVRALVDFLIVSDPDLSRLRLALRAVLSSALGAVLLSSLASTFQRPNVSTLLGTLLGLMSSVLVRDARVAEQRLTHLLLLGPALLAVALAVVLAGHPLPSALAFLAIVFVAVYVRRFGPRATALGMIGFIGYFDATYFHAPLAELPWLLGAVVVGILSAFLVRFAIVRETPRVLLKHALDALVHQARRTEAVAELALETPDQYEKLRPRMRAEINRLNDIALTIDEHLRNISVDRRIAVRLAVLDVELAAARLARRLREALIDHRREAPDPALAFPAAVAQLERAWQDPLIPAVRGGEAVPAADLASVPSTRAPAAGEAASELRPSTRQAIQAVVACGMASLGGHLVSENRWYWAVLTAFLVFNQVHTTFDTVVRAWHRVVGTLGGVLAGSLLAHYVAHERTLALALVFVCIFCGFYLLRVSYAWMVFWLSAVLVLLYGLLGRDAAGLLEVRVLETLVGAVSGVAAAVAVLPARATRRVEGLLSTLLRRLEAYLAAAFVERRSFDELFERSRRVDAALHEFREAAEPLANNVLPTGRRLNQVAEAASLVVMVARHAVYDSRSPSSDPPPRPESSEVLAAAAARVLEHVRRLSRELETSGAGADPLPLLAAQIAEAPLPPLFERVAQALSSLDLAVRAWHKS